MNLTCYCKRVQEHEVRLAFDNGNTTTRAIKRCTGAGTGCGSCIQEVDMIVNTKNALTAEKESAIRAQVAKLEASLTTAR